MAHLLRPYAQARPDEPAITDEWGSTTWRELNERVDRLAGALRARGLGTGAAIAIHSGNRREHFELMAAATHVGLRYVLVNWHWSADELRYVLDDSGAAALFSEAAFGDVAAAVNYGEIIDTFSDEYGVKVNQVEPDASSRREIEAAAQLKPDVFDLSLEVAVANAPAFAPYRVQRWQDIPDNLKDFGGRWYAGYGGYMSIGYDPRKVAAPTSYTDLLKPGYSVSLPGDPRQTSSAFNGVMAASLSDGKAEAARGVEFFGRLKKAGNLAATERAASVVVDWDYHNAERAAHEASSGKPGWKVAIPGDTVLSAYYVQAIAKNAPHPAAARLWQEFLFSDRGQNLFLKGYARPSRMEALQMHGTLDRDLAARLPVTNARPVILTIPETDTAKTYLQREWAAEVG